MKKTLAAAGAALLGAVVLSGCSTVADKETTLKWAGHYNGTGLTMSGEGQPVEITLDQYQCFTGFYSLKGDVMELKTSGEGRTFYFRTTEPGRMELLDDEGNPVANPPEGCCVFERN